MNLSNENIEEYILLLADNELDEAAENEVMAFVEQHTAYKPMLEAYLATRLDSAESFVFPDKESLLKPESTVLPLRRTNIKPLKLAAAVAVLLGIGVAITLMFKTDPPVIKDNVIVAKKGAIKNTVVPSGKATKDTTALIVQVSKQKNVPTTNISKQQTVVNNITHNVIETVRQEEHVPAQLASASVNEMAIDAVIQPQTIAMIKETQPQENEYKSLPQWLPVAEENLQGVNDLVAHIQNIKERIQEKTQSLKNTAFVIRFGDKQISIGK
jgi:hypothetical protein